MYARLQLRANSSSRQTLLKKFKFAFGKSRQDAILSEIIKINTSLEKLALQQTRITTAQTYPRQSHAVESYNRIRNHARSLYSVFQEMFRSATCPCKGPHNASLRLQRMSTEHKNRDGPRLKVLFDFEDNAAKRRDWRTFEVQMENLPEVVVSDLNDLDEEVESNPLSKKGPKRRADAVTGFLVARGHSPMRGTE